MKHFHLGAKSGVIAATVSGVVFAWRNPSTTHKQYLQRVRFTLSAVANPTAVALAEMQMNLQSVFSANYTGGTDISIAATTAVRARILDTQRIVASSQVPSSVLATGNVRIADTGALSAGGGDVIDTHPYIWTAQTYPAVATAQAVPPLILEWKNPSQGLDHEDPTHGCIPLAADTGFNLTLPTALAAGFSAKLGVSIDWLE